MANANMGRSALGKKVREMALEGKTITRISKELDISWNEAYTLGWRGAKVRITNRLNKLADETNPEKRRKLAKEADLYVDFIYDAAKHLRTQVDSARKSLNR